MSALLALFWLTIVAAMVVGFVRMYRMTALPCELGEDGAYCNPSRPQRPS